MPSDESTNTDQGCSYYGDIVTEDANKLEHCLVTTDMGGD